MSKVDCHDEVLSKRANAAGNRVGAPMRHFGGCAVYDGSNLTMLACETVKWNGDFDRVASKRRAEHATSAKYLCSYAIVDSVMT